MAAAIIFQPSVRDENHLNINAAEAGGLKINNNYNTKNAAAGWIGMNTEIIESGLIDGRAAEAL